MLESIGIKLFAILFMMIVNQNQEQSYLQGIVTDLPGINKGGQVLVKQTENGEAKVAQIKDIIYQNGVIATGKSNTSNAELTVNNKTSKAVIRISNNTYFKLSPSSQETRINLNEGKVLVQKSGNLNLNVYVGNYIAATEGTTYTVEAVRKNGKKNNQVEANIKVYEGLVMFVNNKDSVNKSKFILPGENAKFVLDEFVQTINGKTVFNYKLNNFNTGKIKLTLDDPIFKNPESLINDNLNEIRKNIFLQQNNHLEKINRTKRSQLVAYAEDFVTSGKSSSSPRKISYDMDRQMLSIVHNSYDKSDVNNTEYDNAASTIENQETQLISKQNSNLKLHNNYQNFSNKYISSKGKIENLNEKEILNKINLATKDISNNLNKAKKEEQEEKIDSYRKMDKFLKSI